MTWVMSTSRVRRTESGMGSSLSTSRLPMLERMHCRADSSVSWEMSAPTYPCVSLATWLRSTSADILMSLVLILRISSLPSSSGMPMSNSLSNLPGRRRAVSMTFGLLVAPITITLPFRPSMSVRSWETMRFSVSPWAESRLGAMLSSSSMKMIEGAFFMASSKEARRFCSDSPPLRLMISGPLMTTTWAPVSSTRALASSVLPQPGGPCRSTPFGVGTPAVLHSSGKRRGISTSSLMSFTALAQPPTDS
mmetsp:Transcript_16544/g.32974  ORF Transcript_16544/g.32974 Transcript_16544/m.32974 type:complete len:250 (+) Transcript_16544:353-1102(+)